MHPTSLTGDGAQSLAANTPENVHIASHVMGLCNRLFYCRVGDAAPYHTLSGVRHRYYTLGYAGPTEGLVLDSLADDLWKIAKRMPLGSPLFWRYEGAIILDQSRKVWHARTRIAVPGYDWGRYADPRWIEEGERLPLARQRLHQQAESRLE